MEFDRLQFDSFAPSVFETYDLEKFSLDKKVALASIGDELHQEFSELNSLEVHQERMNYFKVGRLEDYAEQIFDLNDEKRLICGIRHLGAQLENPFLSLIPNFKIQSKKEALLVAREVLPHFEVFKPLSVRVWAAQALGGSDVGAINLVSRAMRSSSCREIPEREGFVLRKVSDESYFRWYENGYAEFHRKRPGLKSKVTVNSRETMKESLDQGLLFEALFEGERVGLIAAVQRDFLGHLGLYFNEIFIDEKWRGQGIAKWLQNEFLKQVCLGGEFIWGEIDAENAPSLKTARANGRQPVRFECFFKI